MSYPKIARVHIKLHLLAVWFHELMFDTHRAKAAYWTDKKGRRFWEITDVHADGRYPCYGHGELIDGQEIVTIHYK